jgi:signal transduction histidine kinase
MVDLAKLEANHLSLNVKRHNLQKMFAKAVSTHKPTNGTALKITLQDTPPVYGDELWLDKLFTHVIGNAIKFTPNGEIIVNAERAGEMLKVAVKDTGVGIEPEKQKAIFESFNQGQIGADRPYEGAGLGLAISRKVVELHGGRIWFSSSPGKGSNFYFTLPLKPTSLKTVELA